MSDAAPLWQSLQHSWTRDQRAPLYTFELHDETWGFYGMSLVAWHMVLGFVLLQAVAMVLLFSPVVYKLIIKKQGSALSYLVCFLIIPLSFVAPYYASIFFNIRNQIIRYVIGGVMPVTCMFKTTAATFGFTPEYAKHSWKNFALFYGTPMLMHRDPKLDKFVPNDLAETLRHVKDFFLALLLLGFLQSLMNYAPILAPPFGQGQLPPDSDWYDLRTLLYPHKWVVRNWFFGVYFQVFIATCSEGLIVAQGVATGYKTRSNSGNPMFTSRSCTQFWGRKWNPIIHDALKMGVYLPVRKYCPKNVAMLCTFLASGLFHEVLLIMFSYPLDDQEGCLSVENAAATIVDCYAPRLFFTTFFFLSQAAIIAVEQSPLGQFSFWSSVPTKVTVVIAVFYVGAFVHYFAEPYWNSLLFENASMLFFVFKPVRSI